MQIQREIDWVRFDSESNLTLSISTWLMPPMNILRYGYRFSALLGTTYLILISSACLASTCTNSNGQHGQCVPPDNSQAYVCSGTSVDSGSTPGCCTTLDQVANLLDQEDASHFNGFCSDSHAFYAPVTTWYTLGVLYKYSQAYDFTATYTELYPGAPPCGYTYTWHGWGSAQCTRNVACPVGYSVQTDSNGAQVCFAATPQKDQKKCEAINQSAGADMTGVLPAKNPYQYVCNKIAAYKYTGAYSGIKKE